MAKKKVNTNNFNAVKSQKQVKYLEDPANFDKQKPSWRIARCDKDHSKWKVNDNETVGYVLNNLSDLEGMTWAEIKSTRGHRTKGSMHHYIKISDMNKSAQKRAREIKLDEETDELFSIALNGRERVFGNLLNGVFHVIWYDKNHEICPSTKKHT